VKKVSQGAVRREEGEVKKAYRMKKV
jgi:hypothetical protein